MPYVPSSIMRSDEKKFFLSFWFWFWLARGVGRLGVEGRQSHALFSFNKFWDCCETLDLSSLAIR